MLFAVKAVVVAFSIVEFGAFVAGRLDRHRSLILGPELLLGLLELLAAEARRPSNQVMKISLMKSVKTSPDLS